MADNLVAQILHLAAFSDGDQGGNPAGVLLADEMPPEADMLAATAAVGYSETAFLAPHARGRALAGALLLTADGGTLLWSCNDCLDRCLG